jgi:hypothetical protein
MPAACRASGLRFPIAPDSEWLPRLARVLDANRPRCPQCPYAPLAGSTADYIGPGLKGSIRIRPYSSPEFPRCGPRGSLWATGSRPAAKGNRRVDNSKGHGVRFEQTIAPGHVPPSLRLECRMQRRPEKRGGAPCLADCESDVRSPNAAEITPRPTPRQRDPTPSSVLDDKAFVWPH